MGEIPYLKQVICLCVIVIGIVSVFYSVTERRVGYTTEYMIDPQTGLPVPYSVPYYYEETVYPYRSIGVVSIYVGSIFLILSIIFDKIIHKGVKNERREKSN